MPLRPLPAHVSPRLQASSNGIPLDPDTSTALSDPTTFSHASNKLDLPLSMTSSSTSDFDLAPSPANVLGILTPPTDSDSTGPDEGVKSSSNTKSADSYPTLIETLPEVKCVVRARIPTTNGTEMFLHLYKNNSDTKEHLAIVFGTSIRSESLDRVIPGETEMDRMIRGAYVGRLYPGRTSSESSTGTNANTAKAPTSDSNCHNGCSRTAPLVRIHSECYTGETVWSARCDCGEQLDEAARLISESDPSVGGVVVYLRQEGRGIGLSEKLKAYNLQDLGNDTYEANLLLRHPADARSYGLATAILIDLGLGGSDPGIRLLTNNPDKVRAVEGPAQEVTVAARVPMVPLAWQSNGEKGVRGTEVDTYLATKIEKFKHMLEM